MNQHSRFITIAFVSGCCLIQGCTSVKKTLGIDRPPPDEFSVTPSIQPLDMPPDFFALPPPVPGTPRPQDVKELDAKREKILGTSQQTGKISPGQKALLDLAGAEQGQDNIRRQVDEESHIEHAKGGTLLHKLGIKKRKVGEPLNPHEEVLELQKQGIPQNPAVVPE